MTIVNAVILVAISLLFSGGCIAIAGALLLFHYIVHTKRIGEQDACFKKIRELSIKVSAQEDHILKLESLNASMAIRLIEVLKILSIEAPARKVELGDMVDSLIKLLHAYPSVASISLDAEGDIRVGGDVTGHDKIKSTVSTT
jgi:hypothetical protein